MLKKRKQQPSRSVSCKRIPYDPEGKLASRSTLSLSPSHPSLDTEEASQNLPVALCVPSTPQLLGLEPCSGSLAHTGTSAGSSGHMQACKHPYTLSPDCQTSGRCDQGRQGKALPQQQQQVQQQQQCSGNVQQQLHQVQGLLQQLLHQLQQQGQGRSGKGQGRAGEQRGQLLHRRQQQGLGQVPEDAARPPQCPAGGTGVSRGFAVNPNPEEPAALNKLLRELLFLGDGMNRSNGSLLQPHQQQQQNGHGFPDHMQQQHPTVMTNQLHPSAGTAPQQQQQQVLSDDGRLVGVVAGAGSAGGLGAPWGEQVALPIGGLSAPALHETYDGGSIGAAATVNSLLCQQQQPQQPNLQPPQQQQQQNMPVWQQPQVASPPGDAAAACGSGAISNQTSPRPAVSLGGVSLSIDSHTRAAPGSCELGEGGALPSSGHVLNTFHSACTGGRLQTALTLGVDGGIDAFLEDYEMDWEADAEEGPPLELTRSFVAAAASSIAAQAHLLRSELGVGGNTAVTPAASVAAGQAGGGGLGAAAGADGSAAGPWMGLVQPQQQQLGHRGPPAMNAPPGLVARSAAGAESEADAMLGRKQKPTGIGPMPVFGGPAATAAAVGGGAAAVLGLTQRPSLLEAGLLVDPASGPPKTVMFTSLPLPVQSDFSACQQLAQSCRPEAAATTAIRAPSLLRVAHANFQRQQHGQGQQGALQVLGPGMATATAYQTISGTAAAVDGYGLGRLPTAAATSMSPGVTHTSDPGDGSGTIEQRLVDLLNTSSDAMVDLDAFAEVEELRQQMEQVQDQLSIMCREALYRHMLGMQCSPAPPTFK